MQFKVPQDVQQPDRILVFLTLPQLIICVIGFAVAYAIFTVLNRQGLPMLLWLPPVVFVGLLTVAFAFLKISNLPFHHYLAILIERLFTPSKRVWVKGADRVSVDETELSPEEKKRLAEQKKTTEVTAAKENQLQHLEDLTREIDVIDDEDEDEDEETVPIQEKKKNSPTISPLPTKIKKKPRHPRKPAEKKTSAPTSNAIPSWVTEPPNPVIAAKAPLPPTIPPKPAVSIPAAAPKLPVAPVAQTPRPTPPSIPAAAPKISAAPVVPATVVSTSPAPPPPPPAPQPTITSAPLLAEPVLPLVPEVKRLPEAPELPVLPVAEPEMTLPQSFPPTPSPPQAPHDLQPPHDPSTLPAQTSGTISGEDLRKHPTTIVFP